MDPKDRAIFSRLLDTGLNLQAHERLAWVEGLGDEYAALKPRLRKLLGRSLEADSNELLATLPKFDRKATSAYAHFDSASQAVGMRVGPYRLLRCLGIGAMGAVWLARVEGEVVHSAGVRGAMPREVALKFAHAAERGASLAARLAREQQLLAALDHPNIARLLGADVSGEGQPYLVLEYVAGVQLQDYCSQQRPNALRRLSLFAQIARAVAHAHAQQIVHRDLKPANVMVAHDGSARLLDFGIGKLLSDGLPAELQLSRLTGQPLTPAYASPEQILGSPAGLPSDVYSLGVICYELLSGARPYVYKRGSNRGLRDAILNVVPPPPSQRYVAPEFSPSLRTQLDALVLKALEKRVERRYPSARELSAELDGVLLTERVLH